ncbi:glycine receptor subunit alpha-3 [Trichonephila clavipes]|nr:glycine receptor subunit alpha-3 [Trichonephila clavipes]
MKVRREYIGEYRGSNNFREIDHYNSRGLMVFERGTGTAARHRDEGLEPYVHLSTGAGGPDCILRLIGSVNFWKGRIFTEWIGQTRDFVPRMIVRLGFHSSHCSNKGQFLLSFLFCFNNVDLGVVYSVQGGLSFNDILPEDPKMYDKMKPPKKDGKPTKVFFHVTVMGLDSINEGSMTYAADIFFAQTWKDPRLRLPENMTSEYRLLEVQWLENMWRPDSYFKNAKSVTFQTMTIPNHYVWLYQNKDILYMVKKSPVESDQVKVEIILRHCYTPLFGQHNGAPVHKTSPMKLCLIKHIVRSQRSQTLAQITTLLNDVATRTISKRTVQHSLHRMGFGSRRHTRVPLFNARHRVARLACARDHRDSSVADWRGLETSGKCKRAWWLNHGLGCFIVALFGSLVRVPTSLNAIRSIELLGDHLHPFILFCYPHGNGVFQQDNCTSHKSRLATGWLDEHSSYFSVINWPPRRSDLNLIKNLWVVLEEDVKGHHTAPTNLTELWTALANIWQVIPVERFQNFVESVAVSI